MPGVQKGANVLRNFAIALLLLIGLGAPHADAREQTSAPSRPPSMNGPWDMIVFEVKSWGRPVTSWIMTPDGGSWTESKDGASFQDYSLIVHEVEKGEGRFRELSAIVARLPSPAPTSQPCTDFMTDLPYGTMRLTRGATTIELAFNSGCRDAPYVKFLDVLQAADQLVAGWGKTGKVLRTENPASR